MPTIGFSPSISENSKIKLKMSSFLSALAMALLAEHQQQRMLGAFTQYVQAQNRAQPRNFGSRNMQQQQQRRRRCGWNCNECDFFNNNRRQECYACNAPRPVRPAWRYRPSAPLRAVRQEPAPVRQVPDPTGSTQNEPQNFVGQNEPPPTGSA